MEKYVSMLRGINVGGHQKIRMEELRALYEDLNFQRVKSYIQSGNVIFTANQSNIAELTSRITEKIKHTFNFPVTVIIRTEKELEDIIQNNTFLKQEKVDISRLYLTFLSDTPAVYALSGIGSIEGSYDQWVIAGNGKEIYLYCPHGYGRTKLTNNFFEKKLGIFATTRNWKTVNKLYDLVREI